MQKLFHLAFKKKQKSMKHLGKGEILKLQKCEKNEICTVELMAISITLFKYM